ncbi:hypothetical protein L195_g038733 [Trifolium pratense]|uniref:Uncharacterized protein n=1 Tax=Trifolium pratense TaxID=57577 RepID=A0A2K3LVY5_TRIPR|nr:hypothetical protein L195_g038733 [Trifolium pratense]
MPIIVTNVVQNGGGGNVELGGSLSNPILVNDKEGVSSETEFDDDGQISAKMMVMMMLLVVVIWTMDKILLKSWMFKVITMYAS